MRCGGGNRRSPDKPGGSARRPGNRLPDVAVVTSSGQTTTYALRAYDRWTLLDLGSQRHHRPRQELLDAVALAQPSVTVRTASATPGPATDALGSNHQLVLVRPDGHVAAVVAHDDIANLRNYVGTWLTCNGSNLLPHVRRPG